MAMLCLGTIPRAISPSSATATGEFIVHSEKYRRLGEAELQSMFAELEAELRLPTDLGRRIWGNFVCSQNRQRFRQGNEPFRQGCSADLAG